MGEGRQRWSWGGQHCWRAGDKAEPATERDVPPGLGLRFKQGKGMLERMGRQRTEGQGRGREKGPVGVEPDQPRRRCEDAGGSQEPLLQAWPERAAESEWGATCQALGSLRASLGESRS